MYVTLYEAENRQIVLDTIEDTENAVLLFINCYTFEGNKGSVLTEAIHGIPEALAEEMLDIIEYVHNFYSASEQTDIGLPPCCALVASMEPTPLHRDDNANIVGMFQLETELGELNMYVPSMDCANTTHQLIDHMYKSVKSYINDPRPISEKMGEEIEKELENLK